MNLWTEGGLTVVEGLDMVEKVGGVLEVWWECFEEGAKVEVNEFGDKYGGTRAAGNNGSPWVIGFVYLGRK